MLHLCPNPARRHPTLPDQRALHDPNLSLTAVGLLTRLMNAPADTSTDPQTLAARCGAGRDAIKSAMRELAAAGLLLRTTLRQPSGQLHTVTLIGDDPTMLLTELARLSTAGSAERIAPPATASGAGHRAHRPRHARPATETTHPQHAAPDAAGVENNRPDGHTAGDHDEHYHRCVLRTTHIYINSSASRSAADQHTATRLARTTQENR